VLSDEIDDMGMLMRMLPPVLEASHGKLADVDSSCQELSREVAKLKGRIEQQNTDLALGEAEVSRAARENLNTSFQTDRLRVDGDQQIASLQNELSDAESECTLLRARLADGLKGDREVWESERKLLQTECEKLQAELTPAEAKLKEHQDAEKEAKFQLLEFKEQFKVVSKEAAESAELRHKFDKKNDEAQALRTRIQEINEKMAKKKPKKKGGKGKKK